MRNGGNGGIKAKMANKDYWRRAECLLILGPSEAAVLARSSSWVQPPFLKLMPPLMVTHFGQIGRPMPLWAGKLFNLMGVGEECAVGMNGHNCHPNGFDDFFGQAGSA